MYLFLKKAQCVRTHAKDSKPSEINLHLIIANLELTGFKKPLPGLCTECAVSKRVYKHLGEKEKK